MPLAASIQSHPMVWDASQRIVLRAIQSGVPVASVTFAGTLNRHVASAEEKTASSYDESVPEK